MLPLRSTRCDRGPVALRWRHRRLWKIYSDIESAAEITMLADMGKSKIAATGDGYLGETMVHKISRAIGVVESVTAARAGWPPEITLKLPDGSFKKGRLSDFREASGTERKKFSAP